jgi:uncharacterized protein YndB with AHSA1/START domain
MLYFYNVFVNLGIACIIRAGKRTGDEKMPKNYTIQTKIARPVADVFDAIVSSERMKRYFVNGASGDLVEGDTVIWHWDHYGDNPVAVRKVIENQLIELALDSKEWDKTPDEAYEVLVIFEFEELEDGTMLSISEQGWKTDADGLRGSHDNCGGWAHMSMCLKAWMEHSIDLR